MPKRLRPFFLYNRRRRGTLSQIAYRTLHEYQRAALGSRDVAPGVIVCIQSFGSLAHWHPHLHALMSDGAFRRDGSFVAAPPHDPSVLESDWQHAVLAWFVDAGWLDPDATAAMLAWPHSGFGAHLGPAMPGEDRDGLLRVARYSARELVSDRSDGPYAGTHRLPALEFVNRARGRAPHPRPPRPAPRRPARRALDGARRGAGVRAWRSEGSIVARRLRARPLHR